MYLKNLNNLAYASYKIYTTSMLRFARQTEPVCQLRLLQVNHNLFCYIYSCSFSTTEGGCNSISLKFIQMKYENVSESKY